MVGLDQVATASFAATREIDELAEDIARKIGFAHRYAVPRLAMALSLRTSARPEPVSGDPGRSIRGENLFGTGAFLAAWVSFFIEYEGLPLENIADLQRRVRDHWCRGVKLLWDRLGEVREDPYNVFWKFLAEHLPRGDGLPVGRTEPPRRPGPIALPLGPAAQDPSTGTPPLFRPVARGASPHVAIMGGVGSGKTRTALFMLAELAKQAPVPLVAFDFKGDLTGDATGLDRSFAAEVLDPLERPIPLDVLAFDPAKPHARELAAQRLRDSLAALKGGAFGAVQRGLLGDAAARARQPPAL